ncbi:phage portal protein [Sphingomonas sp. RB56-2]|uniref:Phage portal protein n=1 Tax=Sphingomonas brevis TaxID=2908206 RepID=A0ABT0S676_9SPHN|nr:phage portal protein [Sphingomonas brevis]MCL6739877.1 phage portal protein [Sphingomonas brevis]
MAFWFGRKSAPEKQPFVPVWLQGEGEGGGFARGYAAQLDEVYRRNPVGLRAVRLVAGLAGGLPLFGHEEAVALVKEGGLLEQAAANLLLHGNAYARLAADSHDRPAILQLMRPERVSVACGADGWPSAYLYRAGGQVVRIAKEDALGRRQVAHLKALDPGDDLYGLGCLDAAIGAASVHNRASRWNKALLDNAARPSGALVYEPGDGSSLGPEQFDRLKQELGEQFSGSANAGRPLLLDGGLKWQALGLSPTDMDFVAVKEGAARDIALAFGVPPVLVGLPGDATYANAREAGRALYRQTILPMAEVMLRDLGAMLGDWLGPVTIEVDTDRISELAEDRARLWESVGAAEFLSREEKREQLGFGA